MDLKKLIQHPETMDKETLYDLRSLIALYPYYQPARLLMLQNLYVLHDSTFDEELRKAAIYITDRKVIFNLVEAAHYKLRPNKSQQQEKSAAEDGKDRTISLIDNFLNSIPTEEDSDKEHKKRKPTAADAAVDYVSYLLETEGYDEQEDSAPQMKGQELIDDFINNDNGKIKLQEEPEYVPEIAEDKPSDNESNEGYYTETLARIYIQQGKYDRALEIIKRINLNIPNKNAYFADQIRFLEKLIRNSKAAPDKNKENKQQK